MAAGSHEGEPDGLVALPAHNFGCGKFHTVVGSTISRFTVQSHEARLGQDHECGESTR